MRNEGRQIAGFRSEYANVNGARLHYWIGGDPRGRPVLLWHGFLGTGYSWHKVMPLLADAGYSVLVPDMRGYGDSDKPAGDAGYDGAALAEEFRSLAEQTGFGAGRPLTLIAHDMGAPPALLWTANHPAEVSALLYIEAPVMLESVLEKIINFTPQAMAKGSMWWWILPLAMAQTLPLTQDKLKLPIIAIGGEKGLGERVGHFVSMVAANLQSVVLPGCGHFVPEECPEAVLHQLDRLNHSKEAVK